MSIFYFTCNTYLAFFISFCLRPFSRRVANSFVGNNVFCTNLNSYSCSFVLVPHIRFHSLPFQWKFEAHHGKERCFLLSIRKCAQHFPLSLQKLLQNDWMNTTALYYVFHLLLFFSYHCAGQGHFGSQQDIWLPRCFQCSNWSHSSTLVYFQTLTCLWDWSRL